MKRNIKNLLPMRRQTHLTTQQIANEQLHDIEIDKKLGEMANTATLSDKVPPIPLLTRQVRNSVIDTKTSRLASIDNEVRAKLERIGVQARLTAVDMAAIKTLSRPEQAEVDAYNMRLRHAGELANAIDVVKPDLEPVPPPYEMSAEERRAILDAQKILENTRTAIANADTTPSKKKTKAATMPRWNAAIEKQNTIIEDVRRSVAVKQQERREQIEEVKQAHRDALQEYADKLAALTTDGMSTARELDETDEQYMARMQENVMVSRQQDQQAEGKIYIAREFINKLKSLNLAMDVVDSTVKTLNDEVKEWVLSAWNVVKTEFVKNFGTNPYRLKTNIVVDFISNLFDKRRGATAMAELSRSVIQQQEQQQAQQPQSVKIEDFEPSHRASASAADASEVLQRRQDLSGVATESKEEPEQEDIGGAGFRNLGKKKVHSKKLMGRNMLDVRHAHGGNIYGFPVVSVSDLFVSYVNRLVNNQKVSDTDINKLNTNEASLFRRLLHLTSVSGGHLDKANLEPLTARLKLIEDEVRSGNDSPHLLKEANELLNTLAIHGKISKAEKSRFYKQLCKLNA